MSGLSDGREGTVSSMAKNTNQKNTAGKVTPVSGVAVLAFSAAFLVMGLMGVAVVQENSGGIGNIIGIAMAAFFIHHGRSMLKDDN